MEMSLRASGLLAEKLPADSKNGPIAARAGGQTGTGCDRALHDARMGNWIKNVDPVPGLSTR